MMVTNGWLMSERGEDASPLGPDSAAPSAAAPAIPGEGMTVEFAGCTDVGQRRDHQEDAYDMPILPLRPEDYERGLLFIVADGVGGLRAGDEASRLAVVTARETFDNEWSPDMRYTLEQAVARANAAVFTKGQEPAFSGMGTTIVGCVLRHGQMTVAHVGDSRLYRLRDGVLLPLTVDHSFVQDQVRLGVLTEDEARSHPQRHLISRSLGTRPTVEVEMRQVGLRDGDRLLLCSDGLYDLVADEDIVAALRLPLRDGCRELIDRANAAGGSDNITVVLVAVALPHDALEPLNWGDDDEATLFHPLAEEQTAERPAER